MRYLFSVIDDRTGSSTPEEDAAIDEFNARLRAEGRWVLAAGIEDPAGATTIDDRDGAGEVSPGPFVRTSEHVAGFWIVEAESRDDALALAAEASRACHRRVEVRALL
ncbi:YciI family protein [Demequina mangrovi]|uniref:Uncharacterized conserved protein n=1 Tax=Demequina mangrovi TaxID=1043493 RepID=A0A1H7ACR3_9MICO|nr:YciI family protein [Demequina mangrovi]SEJ63188.1 Uncharacterized conserved protein [Demequina mangrovi]